MGFDVLLVDLQDIGCRIYTFVTTLRYVLEAAAEQGQAGGCSTARSDVPIEGLRLRAGWRKSSSARDRCRCATA